MSKTYSSIITDMRSYIRSLYPSAQTHEGSILNDIVIAAPAREMALLYEKNTLISRDQSIATATQAGLEKWGSNLNKYQKPAIPAIGTVTFFSNTAPTTNITISANTIVSTRSGVGVRAQQFRTIRKVIMYTALAASYLNPTTGKYEISVDVEAMSPGITGIVGAYTIDSIQGTLTGINGVYNLTSTSGGEDFENTSAFSQRLAAAFAGTVLGTVDGYLTEVLANENVTAVSIVSHGDTGRELYNAVDIYYKGSNLRYYTDVFNIPSGVSTTELVFTKQPVVSGSIQTLIYGATGSLIGPVPTYSFVRDSSLYGGSIYGQDKLVFNNPLEASLGTAYIIYTYNVLSEELQNLFTKTNKDLLNVDVLIKAAAAILIDMDLDVTILTGFDSVLVTLDIQNAIALFLDSLDIGEELQMADVAREVLNIGGVDDILLPFATFRSSDSTIVPDSSNNLTIPANSYPVANTITINVVV